MTIISSFANEVIFPRSQGHTASDDADECLTSSLSDPKAHGSSFIDEYVLETSVNE